MALPSQTAPLAARRRRGPVSSRRVRSRFIALGTIAGLTIALASWWMLSGDDEEAGETGPVAANTEPVENEAPAEDTDRETAPPVATVLAHQSLDPTPGPPEPDRIIMGDSRSQPSEPAGSTESAGATTPKPPRSDGVDVPATSLAIKPSAEDDSPAASGQGRESERATQDRPANRPVAGGSSSPPAGRSTGRAANLMRQGLSQASAGRPVEARATLTAALLTGELDRADATSVRGSVSELNDQLVFSPEARDDDPFVLAYTIQANDSLAKITKRLSLAVDWRFVQRVNEILRPEYIRVGQRLKLVTGPFHAVVDKSEYRLDLYLGDPPDQVYVRSFEVGLGEHNSTPVGLFRVRPSSKLINPAWVNPRTREQFGRDDPKNPIGEHWIGLEGIDEHLEELAGYGLHGTIDVDSIGHQASMGCVRLRPEDVALIYEVLVEEISLVRIVE